MSEAPVASDGFAELASRLRERVNAALDDRLPVAGEHAPRLHEAMRYAVLNGGKRVRAILVYTSGAVTGAQPTWLDVPACAVEMVHAYSLVHDDLPAMDDDDLRRGVPTCHRAFDEATALLAGDALQALAFDVLAGDPDLGADASTRVAMVATLASASGSLGMAGGQAIDLAAVGQRLSLAELENMHRHKTGALIRASVAIGAMCGPRAAPELLERLDRYAACIGLAFQIRDDILDVEGDTETLGKTQGADIALGKPTYPSTMGLAAAKEYGLRLHHEALEALAGLGDEAGPLRWLSDYIVNRPS